MLKIGEIFKICYPIFIWADANNDEFFGTLGDGKFIIILDIKKIKERYTCFLILTSQGIFTTTAWLDVANFERCVERIAQ